MEFYVFSKMKNASWSNFSISCSLQKKNWLNHRFASSPFGLASPVSEILDHEHVDYAVILFKSLDAKCLATAREQNLGFGHFNPFTTGT